MSKFPIHIPLDPDKTGLKIKSFVKTEDIRSISKKRLQRYIGTVEEEKLNDIKEVLGILLDI